jgi:hypothetical protein
MFTSPYAGDEVSTVQRLGGGIDLAVEMSPDPRLPEKFLPEVQRSIPTPSSERHKWSQTSTGERR